MIGVNEITLDCEAVKNYVTPINQILSDCNLHLFFIFTLIASIVSIRKIGWNFSHDGKIVSISPPFVFSPL